MAKRAINLFRFEIQGDGRNETLVRQPLSANSDFSVITGGASSLNSPGMMTSVYLAPGWNQLIDPAAYLQAPMSRVYFEFKPPTGSTFPKVLAGSTLDVGVSMTPNLPLKLALPAGPVSIYIYNAGPTGEQCGLKVT